jgi:hypothetical protein
MELFSQSQIGKVKMATILFDLMADGLTFQTMLLWNNLIAMDQLWFGQSKEPNAQMSCRRGWFAS